MLEKAVSYASSHKKEIFFVFLIFLLAFGVRGQLMVCDLMFEFDSYFHARIGEYIAKHLTIPLSDPGAYYQFDQPGEYNSTNSLIGVPLPEGVAFFWIFT